MNNGRLTQKQETFCLKYFELGNASEAARIAKYSPKTAFAIGAENLSKPKIQARIDELRAEAKSAAVMDFAERQERLTTIARQSAKTCAICGNSHVGSERNGIASIDLINKMDKVYEAGTGVVVPIQILNINVSSEKAKGLTERMLAGERTGDNGHKPDDGDNGHKDI